MKGGFRGETDLKRSTGGEGEPEQKPQPVLEPIENPTRKIEVWSAQEVTPHPFVSGGDRTQEVGGR